MTVHWELTCGVLPRRAGLDPLPLSPSCWTCQGNSCSLQGEYAELGPTRGTTSIASAFISVSAGWGMFTMSYGLINGGGTPNSWRTTVTSVDASFEPLVLETLDNSPLFDISFRSIPFNLPVGTTVVKLAFKARQVRRRHPDCVVCANI